MLDIFLSHYMYWFRMKIWIRVVTTVNLMLEPMILLVSFFCFLVFPRFSKTATRGTAVLLSVSETGWTGAGSGGR